MPVTVPAPSVRAAASSTSADLDALADHETPKLKRRLIASLGFLLVLMYFSMGHMMWGWPLPRWFDGNHIAMGLVQLLLAGIVMVINQKFFINGFKGLLHGSPNMDKLGALGYAGGHGFHGKLCVEHLRPVRHDPRAGGRQQRAGHALYDGVLL